MITQRCRLNTFPCGLSPLVIVSQYDTARIIEFELDDGQYIPTEAKIRIGENEYEGTISNGIVSFNVPSELTQEAKTYLGEIVVTNVDGKFGTLNFRFVVDSTPLKQTNTLTVANPLSNALKTALKESEEEDELVEDNTDNN